MRTIATYTVTVFFMVLFGPAATGQELANNYGAIEGGFDCAVQTEVPEAECEALVALYNSTDGDNWTNNSGWLADPVSTWFGVTVSGGHVETLYLGVNSLTGGIPPELGNLLSLQTLDLNGNSLTGSIPSELGNLSSLQYLNLNGNSLTGNIPSELGSLSNLQELNLGNNALAGSIPSELGNLSGLQTLNLNVNSLTGSIPPELGNLSNLQVLFLGSTMVAGSIPAELGNLSNLQVLYLGVNSLTGGIPPELGNLSSLQTLDLRFNSLEGGIPSELGKLSNLQRLNLSTNSLAGSIPSELGDLSSLQDLFLNSNSLTGSIPLSFTSLALTSFWFNDTGLCESQDSDFQAWLDGITYLQSTEVLCEALQYMLTVESQNPGSGIAITVSPADENNDGNGTTEFVRTYEEGTSVTLTAPATAPGGTLFAEWEVGGTAVSGNPIQITMDADHTATAVYEQPTCTLSITSEDPASNVTITVGATDLNGDSDGVTPFTRSYVCGTEVDLEAPSEADGNIFTRWLLDGEPETTDQAMTVTVDENRTATAVYGSAPRILTVASQNPDTGIEITVSPSDNDGDADGTTAFSRTYDDGTTVTLTAPATASNGNPFAEWQLDGSTASTDLSLQVTMNTSHTATAVYNAVSHTLTVASQNPDSGIEIAISPDDSNGKGDGTTAFGRTYVDGTQVTLTAPEESPNGNPFGKWTCDGTETTDMTHDLTLTSDVTCTASFLIPPEQGSIETEVGETVMLNWSDVPGADRYHMQISDESSFGKYQELLVDVDTVTVSAFEVPPGLLSSDQNYYWRIRSGVDREADTRWSAWSDQIVIPTSVERIDDTVPQSFTLENYPNPFNPVTTIRYALPAADHVTLQVFDATGRHIATLVDTQQAAGHYETAFEAGTLPSGTYFYRLQVGTYQETKTMLLIK